MFFENIMRVDRPVIELMTADYTFVNERAGAPLRDGEHLRQPVPLCASQDEARRGLLGQAASCR